MVVRDLHLIAAVIGAHEADPILFVDVDRVLAGTPAMAGLELIPGRYPIGSDKGSVRVAIPSGAGSDEIRYEGNVRLSANGSADADIVLRLTSRTCRRRPREIAGPIGALAGSQRVAWSRRALPEAGWLGDLPSGAERKGGSSFLTHFRALHRQGDT
jgi:hypothetical protein